MSWKTPQRHSAWGRLTFTLNICIKATVLMLVARSRFTKRDFGSLAQREPRH